MYKNILVPMAIDHGQNIPQALAVARALRAEGGKMTLLNVVEQLPAYVAHYLPDGQMASNIKDAETSLRAEVGGEKDIGIAVVSGHAGMTITEYAAEMENDLIVIASHRPGLQDYFLGSTAARVVRHASCAVHVVR
jgi:universal stress protein F